MKKCKIQTRLGLLLVLGWLLVGCAPEALEPTEPEPFDLGFVLTAIGTSATVNGGDTVSLEVRYPIPSIEPQLSATYRIGASEAVSIASSALQPLPDSASFRRHVLRFVLPIGSPAGVLAVLVRGQVGAAIDSAQFTTTVLPPPSLRELLLGSWQLVSVRFRQWLDGVLVLDSVAVFTGTTWAFEEPNLFSEIRGGIPQTGQWNLTASDSTLLIQTTHLGDVTGIVLEAGMLSLQVKQEFFQSVNDNGTIRMLFNKTYYDISR